MSSNIFMKRISKLIGLLALIIGLVLFLLLFVQSSSNDRHREVIIKKHWSSDAYDDYLNQTFEIGLPLGMAYWSEKIGFKMQTSRFVLPPHTSVWNYFNLLRKNRNQTVNVIIPPGIFYKEIERILIKQFAFEMEEIRDFFMDSDNWNELGTDTKNWASLVIPNTYNFSRNTDLFSFFERLASEKSLFWNADRKRKLRKQKLTLQESVALASIVQKESLKTDEYETIAGVYLNRLRINMFLGADPTLVFIRGKGGRVYNKDMNQESPYNTYRNKGLPPGPICIPSKEAIDAVLNYTEHPYLYFCAKSDLSGYHVFARHYRDHLTNARLFQRKLNELERKRNVKR